MAENTSRSLKIPSELYDRLEHLKLVESESFASVIVRALDTAEPSMVEKQRAVAA